jgi:hypothetical protein
MSRFERDVGAVGSGIGGVMQAGFNDMEPGIKFLALILTAALGGLSWFLDIDMNTMIGYFVVSIIGLIVAPRFTVLVIINTLVLSAAEVWYWPGWLALLLVYSVCFLASLSLNECNNIDEKIAGGFILGLLILGTAHFFDFSVYYLHVTWHDYVILLITSVLITAIADSDYSESIIAHLLLSTVIMYCYCTIFAPGLLNIIDILNDLIENFSGIYIYHIIAPLLLTFLYRKISDSTAPQSFKAKFGKLLIMLLMSFCIVFWSTELFGNTATGISLIICALYVLFQISREVVFFVRKAFK